MLAEPRFCDGEIREGHRDGHLLVTPVLFVLERVSWPVVVGPRIALQVEALLGRYALVGVVAEQRVGAGLNRQLGLPRI